MMTRLSLRGDWQSELRRMFPRVTPAQIEAFAALAVADKLLTDEGALSDAGHLWWRVAFALQADGWYLRQDIIWHKPNPMPESVRDRCTKAHEYLFLLSKSDRYYFDADAIKEPQVTGATAKYHGSSAQHGYNAASGNHRDKSGSYGDGETRNRRSVWTVTTKPFAGAHFATFPPDLIEPCILAGCPAGGTVLDPFGGSGTTAGVAVKHGRKAILCELNPEYAALMPARVNAIAGDTPDMFMEAAE